MIEHSVFADSEALSAESTLVASEDPSSECGRTLTTVSEQGRC